MVNSTTLDIVINCMAACDYFDEAIRIVAIWSQKWKCDKAFWIMVVNLTYGIKRETRLMLQCRYGRQEGVKRLLSFKADAHLTNANDENALTLACGNGNGDEEACAIARLLLTAPGNSKPQVFSGNGWTPLMIASECGYVDTVQALLEAGAKVNDADTTNRTAMMYASFRGHDKVVSKLLKAGAKLDAVGSKGWTALMHATFGGHTEVVRILLSAGANPQLREQFGGTALIIACNRGHHEVASLLLLAGSQVNAMNHSGRTALMCAAGGGHTECVRRLLSAGGSIHAATENGNTAYSLAIRGQHEEVISILLAAGANPAERRGNLGGGMRGEALCTYNCFNMCSCTLLPARNVNRD